MYYQSRITDRKRNVLPLKPCISMVLVAVLSFVQSCPASAQQVNEKEPATEEALAESKQIRQTIDLGSFQIRELRPTKNETAKVSFTMHLALAPSVDKRTAKQLVHWRHRLRNQVIIAIRVADTKDFLEPGLNHFRRTILLRVNRLLQAALVTEAWLTEFTYTTN